MFDTLTGSFAVLSVLWSDIFFDLSVRGLTSAEKRCCAEIWVTDAWDPAGGTMLPASCLTDDVLCPVFDVSRRASEEELYFFGVCSYVLLWVVVMAPFVCCACCCMAVKRWGGGFGGGRGI